MKNRLSRQSVIVTTLLALTVLALQFAFLGQPEPALAREGFPVFQYEKIVLSPDNLAFNPTGEIIFPSLIKAIDYFSQPLGAYYLYYAPHDKPGGINLAYSNSLDGSWTEYLGNPIISHNWTPHYEVSHVSSPHTLWISDQEELYLYFHGENHVTRLARSTNGIIFTYDSIAVRTSDFNDITEASYARVFEYTIPSKSNKYIMLLMGNNGGSRKIYLAWSDDGKDWTTQPTPLISPTAGEGTNIAAPYFYPWNDNYYVIYHASSGKMHITEIGANFDQEKHLGLFYQDPLGIRAAGPTFFTEGKVQYMFHIRGKRGQTDIALAKYDPTAPRPVETPKPVETPPSPSSQVIQDKKLKSSLRNKIQSDKLNYLQPPGLVLNELSNDYPQTAIEQNPNVQKSRPYHI